MLNDDYGRTRDLNRARQVQDGRRGDSPKTDAVYEPGSSSPYPGDRRQLLCNQTRSNLQQLHMKPTKPVEDF